MLFAAGADRWRLPIGFLSRHQIIVTSWQLDQAQRNAVALNVFNNVKVFLTRQGTCSALSWKLIGTPPSRVCKIDMMPLERMSWLRWPANRHEFLEQVEKGVRPAA